MLFFLAFLFFGASVVRADEVCCYDTDIVPPEIGCYNDDYPFDNMPLPDCLDKIQPSLRMYTRENPDDGLVVTTTTIPSIFNPNRRTHFIVHGWLGGRRSPWMNTHKDLLLDQGDYNIIIVGWSGGSREIWYPGSASNTKVVGTEIALTSLNLVTIGGASWEDLYCTGHSLGGHVCGHAGQRANYFGPFGRITGLDPAGPWFENIDHPDVGLDPTDAVSVDVIHTHGVKKVILNLGTLKPLGHKDFYPNGGGLMPGCIFDPYTDSDEVMAEFTDMVGPIDPTPYDLLPFCSHLRALQFYGESIADCKFYSSQLCSDPYDLPASCVTQPGAVGSMGLHADDFTTEGIMYLETASSDPFCLD